MTAASSNIPDIRVANDSGQFANIKDFLTAIDPAGSCVASVKSLHRTNQYAVKPTSIAAHAKLVEKLTVQFSLLRGPDITTNVVLHGVPPQ